jgi:uncharacterized protein (TIGR02757 family)
MLPPATTAPCRDALESLYRRYNRRKYIAPDPLQFVVHHADPADREIVALIAATLAYGNVASINNSIANALHRLGEAPARTVRDASPDRLRRTFADFRHRWTTGDELAAMLAGAGRVARHYGSLHACFRSALDPDHETVLHALAAFAHELRNGDARPKNSLLADPTRGSACKRLHLFLRWMVRHDDVDPGGWTGVPPARLIIPLDTHMHRISSALGLTTRRQANLATALDITRAFRRIAPDDPARYDFALTRLGIRADANLDAFLEDYAASAAAGETGSRAHAPTRDTLPRRSRC